MNERQETVSTVIPNDYSIMNLKLSGANIAEIGIVKVRDNRIITLYVTDINSTESLDKVMSKVLDITGNDTIFYINAEKDIEILRNKCESMQISISNEFINGNEVLRNIETNQKCFVLNSLDIITKM